MVQVFTDGGCRYNPGPGAWAFAINDYVTGERKLSTTNNEMELTAIYKTLEFINNHQGKDYLLDTEFIINSDSSYAINSITLWSDNWIKDGSITTRANSSLILDIKLLLNELKIKGISILFNKVKGHAGIAGNELVDKKVKELMGI